MVIYLFEAKSKAPSIHQPAFVPCLCTLYLLALCCLCHAFVPCLCTLLLHHSHPSTTWYIDVMLLKSQLQMIQFAQNTTICTPINKTPLSMWGKVSPTSSDEKGAKRHEGVRIRKYKIQYYGIWWHEKGQIIIVQNSFILYINTHITT